MRIFRFVFFILILNLIVSCSSEQIPVTYKTEIRDGVKFVNNFAPKWEKEPKLKLEFIQKIGELETDDENLQFFKPNDIIVEESGEMYILDSGNHRIQKFSKDGKYISTFGKRGQGPGEFLEPGCMSKDKDGNLYVTDNKQLRVKMLSPEGKEIRSIPAPSAVRKMIRTSDGSFISGTEGMPRINMPLNLYNKEGDLEEELGTFEKWEDGTAYGIFNQVSFTLDNSDNLFVAFSTRNKIEKYSKDGKLQLVFDRPLNYEITTEYKTVERKFGSRTIPIPDINRVSRDLTIDGFGRIWVLSYDRQLTFEESSFTMIIASDDGRSPGHRESLKESSQKGLDAHVFHIFSAEGHYLGKIPLPYYGSIIRASKNNLFLIDPRYHMCVYEFKIEEL